jgi:hypothetical protein
MGRAINMENKIDKLDHRLKLVEDALEELVQTRVHHVDLHEDTDVNVDGVEVEPDKIHAPPTTKRKKTTRRKAEATT